MWVAGTISAGRWSLSQIKVGIKHDIKYEYDYAPFAEILQTLIGEGVVVILPRELGLDIALGCKALHGLDHLQVGDIEVIVLGGIVILLGDQYTLCDVSVKIYYEIRNA